MRFHVLGLAHTISTPEYSTCAFTQKVVKLCAMLHRNGHEVIHYGHEDSKVECTEQVDLTGCMILAAAYGEWDWVAWGFPPFKPDDLAYRVFNERAISAIAARKQPGDFLLCMFGFGHRPVADAHKDMIVVEPGIGYAGGYFAPFKVFESYALLHAYLGLDKVMNCSNDMWYDVVIPNFFDPAEFTYREKKGDYLLFLGRLGDGKGLHIAEQLALATAHTLVVAGPGEYKGAHDYRGVAGPEERRELLANAKAVICASTFVEPFCGVQVEAMLSGTPVISTDWGAFTEYNIHGSTGYRCRTFEQFMWAVENIGLISPTDCREQGTRFTMEAIYPMYEEYFTNVRAVIGEKGWYADRKRDTVWRLA